jgi:hypothetical protein
MKLRRGGTGPAHLREPPGDPLLAIRGQRVNLPVWPIRQSSRPPAPHQARFFQPGQRDVDLPGVQRVPERAEHLAQPLAQLITVRWLLRQHRQHNLLLHGIS